MKACYDECRSIRETAKRMHLTRATAKKYIENDVDDVCKYHMTVERPATYGIDQYADEIIKMLRTGASVVAVHEAIIQKHQYAGAYHNFCHHLTKLKANRCLQGRGNPFSQSTSQKIANPAKQEQQLSLQVPEQEQQLSSKWEPQLPEKGQQVLKRSGVFNYIWRGFEITQEHRNYVFTKFPQVAEVANYVAEWRSIFDEQSIPRLALFIERYSKCSLPSIASFARGLTRDIDAIEHAVSSHLSNSYVEGANNKVKVVKRVMYGRCGKPLLAAKILLPHYI